MSQDLLGRFLAAPPRQRLKLASDPANAAALEKALGAEALADYGKLARKLDESHRAADTPPNLIFVPGVMGSLLMSRSLGGVWWIDARARHHFDDLRLRPDGRGDADAAHKVESFAVDISYEGFFAGGLATPDFGHIGCHYDW